MGDFFAEITMGTLVDVGPSGLLLLVVLMILRGILVPRYFYLQTKEALADSRREVATKDAQMNRVLEVLGTTQHVISTLPSLIETERVNEMRAAAAARRENTSNEEDF